MRVFSKAFESRIETIISSLGITSDGLVFGPDATKDECSALMSMLSRNTPVFIPEHLKSAAEGKGLITVTYGMRLNRHEDGIWTDNYEASTAFRYADPDTAEIAYALALAFRVPLGKLSEIIFSRDEVITVSSEEDAVRALRRLEKRERTVVFYEAAGFRDVRLLASAFSGYDAVVLPEAAHNMRKMERALDRVIFSPLVRRLSAVFHSSDGAFCDRIRKEYGRVIRIILIGDVF